MSDFADYAPFVTEGFVSLVGDSRRVPIKILRNTGASEVSFANLYCLSPLFLIRGVVY